MQSGACVEGVRGGVGGPRDLPAVAPTMDRGTKTPLLNPTQHTPRAPTEGPTHHGHAADQVLALREELQRSWVLGLVQPCLLRDQGVQGGRSNEGLARGQGESAHAGSHRQAAVIAVRLWGDGGAHIAKVT